MNFPVKWGNGRRDDKAGKGRTGNMDKYGGNNIKWPIRQKSKALKGTFKDRSILRKRH